jgi:signal transduction histidine kinase
MLNCVVEDNGIGIQPDAGIKEKETERKSFGTKITQERINIINRLKKANGKVELQNLIQGTRAEVTLPIETAY